MDKVNDQVITDEYSILNGDSCEVLPQLPDESIDFSIFSPPFSSLYTYSNSERDLGNSKTDAEFYEHFRFIVKELYRLIKPGRLVAFHCMNLPTSKVNDGYIGIKDFRGDCIRLFQEEGFIYHSEVTIWKNPVVAMQRTKALGLLHKTIRKDSAMSRTGIPDYLVVMRKPGENTNPISHTHEEFPVDLWQKYASPVWMDINQGKVLEYRTGRDEEDERHIAPLQLEVIERALMLWSKEDDVVLTPFLGIGSEAYSAVKMKRKAVGIELKPSYFKIAKQNMRDAIVERNQFSLFDYVDSELT